MSTASSTPPGGTPRFLLADTVSHLAKILYGSGTFSHPGGRR